MDALVLRDPVYMPLLLQAQTCPWVHFCGSEGRVWALDNNCIGLLSKHRATVGKLHVLTEMGLSNYFRWPQSII